MTFSLENYFRELITRADGSFHALWLMSSTILLYAVLSVVLYVLLFENKKNIPDLFFIALISLLIFVFRLPSLAYGESNPDESQWLATVITMQQDPYLYFKDFYVYDFTRTLTIFPLWMVSALGLSVDYGLAKLTGIICWIIFLVSYFYFIKDSFGRKTALLSSSLVAAFLATLTLSDYIAYNSETAAIAFISVSLFAFNRSIQTNHGKYTLSFLAGFALALPLFAKEQTTYIVAGCGMVFVLFYACSSGYKRILFFFFGFCCCFGLFLSPFFIFGKVFELMDWINLLKNHVSVGINFNHLKWNERLNFFNLDSIAYFYYAPIFLLLILILVGNRLLFGWARLQKNIFLLMLLAALYASSFYTAVTPSDFFAHYSMYLIVPTAFAIALCIHISTLINYQRTLVIFIPLCFLFLAKPGLDELTIQLDETTNKMASASVKSVFVEEIIKNSHVGDKMLVWGWDCKLYVDTHLIRGSRYWYNQFLNPIYPAEFRALTAKKYEQDFLAYRPEIVVELLEGGPVVYERPDMAAYPVISKILDDNYTLVYATKVNRIYKLR